MEEETSFSESTGGVVVKMKLDGCLGVATGAGSSSGSSDRDEQLEPKAWNPASGTLNNSNVFSDDNVYKRNHGSFDRANSYMNQRLVKPKLVGNSNTTTEDTVRVQGGNGVLKVTVNNIKKGSGVLKMYDQSDAGLRSIDTVETLELARPLFNSEPNAYSKASSFVGGDRSISELRNSYPPKNDITSEDTIRVQGKNGLLKVTVNNKKKGSGVLKVYDHSEVGLRTIELARPLFYSENKVYTKASSSVGVERSMLKMNNMYSTRNDNARDWISDDIDTSLRLGTVKLNSDKTSAAKVSKDLDTESDNSNASLKDTPRKEGAHKTLKSARGKGEITPPSKMISPTSERKVKCGRGTEKQMLREKLRKMLLNAGWKIDYRPRRNRDYQDSVYINPSGSAYWSIIKAYEAFQKQKQAGEGSDDGDLKLVLRKLTRRTRKKIEKEMKQKQQDVIGYENKGPVNYKSDTPSRAKNALNDSNTESESENNYTGDDNCIGNLGKGKKLVRCTLVASTDTAENSLADENVPCTGLSAVQCQMDASNKPKLSSIRCQMDASNKQEESERGDVHSVCADDDNNDTCGNCGDGGDFIRCNSCPSKFHLACVSMKIPPPGDWNCSKCACKLSGTAGSINPDANNTTASDLLTCSVCQEKYHKSCIQDVENLPVDSTSSSFCGKKCREANTRK